MECQSKNAKRTLVRKSGAANNRKPAPFVDERGRGC